MKATIVRGNKDFKKIYFNYTTAKGRVIAQEQKEDLLAQGYKPSGQDILTSKKAVWYFAK